ncbi:MAG: hypothetical protein COA78_11470 [Blastopirellula sp.]|nr:MAG: hypothetical protein COA78_11470 [Blastopirellula sp.]
MSRISNSNSVQKSFIVLCCVVLSCANSGRLVHAEESTLVDAVEKQDAKVIRVLLKQQSDVNATQADGMTALHWAVYQDDISMTKLLIKAGAKVQSENRYGVTPLSLACRNGNSEIILLLLENDADPNSSLQGGETALMTASRTGQIDAVKLLLDHGAKIEATEKKQQTALMWAAAEGNASVVDLLIKNGADINATLLSGYTPLLIAVRQGQKEAVKILLEAGVDVNEVMRPEKKPAKGVTRGTSALILAIENGHFELAVQLLEAGADPNDQHIGYAPLHVLSWVRKPDYGDNDAGNPSPVGSGNMTSLQFVKHLVKHGAEVNGKKNATGGGRGRFSKKGTTPFLCAAGTGDIDYMKTLVELGADPMIPNDSNTTPLLLAAGIGTGSSGDDAGTEPERLIAVQYLLELGADINAVDNNGETAMHGAAYKTMPKVVHLLAKSGADIKIWSQKSKQGRTPLSIAQGYRPGNFKPSYATVDAIKQVMIAQGVTPPPPPAKKPNNYSN